MASSARGGIDNILFGAGGSPTVFAVACFSQMGSGVFFMTRNNLFAGVSPAECLSQHRLVELAFSAGQNFIHPGRPR